MSTLTLRLEAYDRDARAVIAAAQGLADERKNPEVEPLHLLYRLIERSEPVQQAIRRAGVDPVDVLVESEAQLRRLTKVEGAVAYLSPRMLELLGRAEGEAARGGGVPVDVMHLLIACSQDTTAAVSGVLKACGLSGPVLRATASGETLQPATATNGQSGASRPASSGGKGDPLEQYGRDLTRLAREGKFDPVIGRDGELRRILQVLARRHENNPLLVGEAGIGKSAIVNALAMRIVRGDVPATLQGKRLIALETGALLAGAKLRGEAEERMKALLAAIRDRAGEIILFIPDLGALAGDRAPSGAGQLLSTALGRGELKVIGLATTDGMRKAFEADPTLSRRFVAIAIDPPTADETIAILRGVVPRYEQAHGVRIADPALLTAVRLARRYVPGAQLPKAAIDLIDEAAARVRVEIDGVPAELDALERRLEALEMQAHSLEDDVDDESKRHKARIDAEIAQLRPKASDGRARWAAALARTKEVRGIEQELEATRKQYEDAKSSGDHAKAGELRFGTLPLLEKKLEDARARAGAIAGGGDNEPRVRDQVVEADVADVVAAWTGVPVSRMLEAETVKLLSMEDKLRERVVGQDPAVAAVAKAVRRGRVGLRDPKRPIGSFLFLGPTGVGKTELAKALAEFLFDDELSLTRLDMSEFMEKHMVARLLGSPPGYVDSEEGGFLTEAVRKRPYSVILFDEMEKAHPDVFNILLQVLDDGRLTDSRGRLAYFADTVIIMTSNVGSQAILDHGEGVTREAIRETLDAQLRKHFRPEFLNRIDDVVIFDPLGKHELRGIVEIQLRGLQKLVQDRRLTLNVTDAAKDRLTELGHEPAFGARPLKRVILKNLQDPLAEEILRGGYQPGDTIEIDAKDGAFVFHRLPATT
ncbi:ATP-dependent Clp protease ATP-binding subunit [Sandaracinus amylolyticus]|uniref:Chaperone protein ClpB n=1 Tax=Sandaracinus amylolyticus TaxID=927083 RepID=A0A0F6W731_9BACT|nr:AAA family ATPase [Sandaracinus amylolyticus]AKF08946.1 ClpB protein [Sandaracinus amylolyticus]